MLDGSTTSCLRLRWDRLYRFVRFFAWWHAVVRHICHVVEASIGRDFLWGSDEAKTNHLLKVGQFWYLGSRFFHRFLKCEFPVQFQPHTHIKPRTKCSCTRNPVQLHKLFLFLILDIFETFDMASTRQVWAVGWWVVKALWQIFEDDSLLLKLWPIIG